jgi:glucose-6-phosphate isomerase
MSKITYYPGGIEDGFNALHKRAVDENVLQRIWDYDETLWSDSPDEIINRLGWLHAPLNYQRKLDEITGLWDRVRPDKYTDVVVIGMGGSSLAPEVLMRTFGASKGYLSLHVLDTTDPDAIRTLEGKLNPKKTLFVISTKSGGTIETLSGFKYFYNWTAAQTGANQAGQHFVAITDPGSKLEDLAKEYNFRRTFLNDPNIGGRYSALTYFGLVPGALLGIDLHTVLARAVESSKENGISANPKDSPALALGCFLAAAAMQGRDKLTFISDPTLLAFGDWAEQLIAESTGKDGKGILPVIDELPLKIPIYGKDRVFVNFLLAGKGVPTKTIRELINAGHPVIEIDLSDLLSLGEQLFLWEMTTAVAGWGLSIHPFNQPNVESAKVKAREMIETFQTSGKLPEGQTREFSAETLQDFLGSAKSGDYVSIQAYIEPTPIADDALQTLRLRLRDAYGLATTIGYGPRFLHSTGQLHKGDNGNGLFIQITTVNQPACAIPDKAGEQPSSVDFGILKQAQALGDAEALRSEGRRMICFALDAGDPDTLKNIAGQFSA